VYRELGKTQRLPVKKHGARASKLVTLRTFPKGKCPQLTGPTKLSGKVVERNIMPKVGNKKYAYTKAGKAAAAKAKAKAKKSKKR